MPPIRILQAGHFQFRRWGKPRVSTELKLHNGLIRAGYQVHIFSERDFASFLAPFGARDLGRGKCNRKFKEVVDNLRPDLILLGHCDIIKNETVAELSAKYPDMRIAYRNVDPVFHTHHSHNADFFATKCEVVDHAFLSTGGEKLARFRGKRAKVHYMPNPCDISVEAENNAAKPADSFKHDVVFCGGGDLSDPRNQTLNKAYEALKNELKFGLYGLHGHPAVWGRDYDATLAASKMSLSLNRTEGDYWYTSARISQLMGNGLLTFSANKNNLDDFFNGGCVFFEDADDLIAKIRHYHAHDDQRQQVAATGRNYYHSEMNSTLVAQYIVETTLGLTASHTWAWKAEMEQ